MLPLTDDGPTMKVATADGGPSRHGSARNRGPRADAGTARAPDETARAEMAGYRQRTRTTARARIYEGDGDCIGAGAGGDGEQWHADGTAALAGC